MSNDALLKKFDAVIVLAHLMDKQGNINNETALRMQTAIDAYQRGEVKVIVTSGWAYRADTELPIATVMRKYAIERYNIPEEAIIEDIDARDTVGDAIFTKRNVAVPKGWSSLLVVTSQYHVKRVKEVFDFIYGVKFLIEVRGAPVFENEGLIISEQKSIDAFRNTFFGITAGDDGPILKRLLEAHPFYNGTRNPKF